MIFELIIKDKFYNYGPAQAHFHPHPRKRKKNMQVHTQQREFLYQIISAVTLYPQILWLIEV
jgi:hypothetical protein